MFWLAASATLAEFCRAVEFAIAVIALCDANEHRGTAKMPTAGSTLILELEYVRRNLGKAKWIYIDDTQRHGLGIFAARCFSDGELILRDSSGDYYDGAINYRQACALGLDLSRDCFQIARDRFLVPRGSIDDLINHSCRPNAGIRLTDSGYDLIALQDIEIGDQLTYDYSTYIDSPERLLCCCGARSCRREIGRFRELDPHLRAYYIARGVVGAFAVGADAVQERLVG